MNDTRIDRLRQKLTLGDGLEITFQRTLRIPDDGGTYPLPPGLGCFPIRRVDDYADRVPESWRGHGGVFLPMYQREAMWLMFSRAGDGRPRAVKVGAGKVCALTGERWSETLSARPQNYLVTPPQPWLDGIAVGKGVIRQFVAMPLGMGYTVEGQITGEESVGGLQLMVFEPKPGRFPERCVPDQRSVSNHLFGCVLPPSPVAVAAAGPAAAVRARGAGSEMGLAAGGRMKQRLYTDPHDAGAWDTARTSRVFVHIVNSALWREITGEEPPPSPVTARDYAAHGLPWFDLYDEGLGALDGAAKLAGVSSVKELDAGKSKLPLQDDDPVAVGPVRRLWSKLTGAVRDGDW